MKTCSYDLKKEPKTSSAQVNSQFQSRPFAVQAKPQTQETPDLQAQLESAQRFCHNFTNISIQSPDSPTPPRIQPKLTIGAPGDKYEQEADKTAAKIVQRLHTPVPSYGRALSQPESEFVQRMKAAIVQNSNSIHQPGIPNRENKLMRKLDVSALQREVMPEEDKELQMKPILQHQSSEEGMDASPDIEATIQQARDSGQPLAQSIREPMEQAFGADFSGVKVHTDAQADQLNQSIQAKAFTTGQDVFFRQGAYEPGSRGGQELIAHELTHVVQQNGSEVRRETDEKRSSIEPKQEKQQSVNSGNTGRPQHLDSDLKRSRLLAVQATSLSIGTNAKTIQRKWNVDTFKTQKSTEYQALLEKVDGSSPLIKIGRLRELAEVTDSPKQVSDLLNAMTGESKSATLLDLLRKTGGISGLLKLRPLSSDPAVLARLVNLESDVDVLLKLKEQIPNANIISELLLKTPEGQRGRAVLETLNLAGGFDELKKLAPLTRMIGTLLQLLHILGSGVELQKFVPLAKDGETLLKLLKLTDAATVKSLMDRNKKADFDVLKPLATKAEVTKATVNPKRIRYTQETCTNQGVGYKVTDNIQQLKSDPTWEIPSPPIRVFQKTSAMDKWGGQDTDYGWADPKNLENGQIYTLDNRRLAAYCLADRPTIPQPIFVPENIVKREKWKFTTNNLGTDITIV